jgi:hypothetical protein
MGEESPREFFEVGLQWMKEAKDLHEKACSFVMTLADELKVEPEGILDEVRKRATLHTELLEKDELIRQKEELIREKEEQIIAAEKN